MQKGVGAECRRLSLCPRRFFRKETLSQSGQPSGPNEFHWMCISLFREHLVVERLVLWMLMSSGR